MRILLCLVLLAHALPATAAQRRARPAAHGPIAADVYAAVAEFDRVAARAALWPGFDPLNVERVGARDVLHTRYLKLGGGAGFIELINRRSLTEGAGEHPLFNGLRRLTVTGLDAEPAVTQSGGRTTITAENLKADFNNAEVTRTGRTLLVRLK